MFAQGGAFQLEQRGWYPMKPFERLVVYLRRKKKRIILGFVIALLGGFGLLNFMAYNQAYAMTHFTASGVRTSKPERLSSWQKATVLVFGVNVPRPQSQVTPADAGLPFEEVSIACPGGIRLGAWHCAHKNSKGLVILFHGYACEKSTLLPEAALFHEFGWSVLLVNFRGSGQSSESSTSIGYHEAADVAAAVRFARANLPDSRRVVLYGQSMGAAAVLRAVHKYEVKPDALIVEAVFDSMLNTIRNRFAAMGIPSFPSAQLLLFWGGRQGNFDAFAHNPVEYARSVACPVLFLHGTDDSRVRLEEARRVFDAVPGSKQFKEFPAAKHESYVSRFRKQWCETIIAFLTEAESTK